MMRARFGITFLAFLAPVSAQAVELTEAQEAYLACRTHTEMAYFYVSQCPQKFGVQPPVTMTRTPDCVVPAGLYVGDDGSRQVTEAGAEIGIRIDAYAQAKQAELDWDGNEETVDETVVANICEQIDVEQSAGSETWAEIQRVTRWIAR